MASSLSRTPAEDGERRGGGGGLTARMAGPVTVPPLRGYPPDRVGTRGRDSFWPVPVSFPLKIGDKIPTLPILIAVEMGWTGQARALEV